jgi:hypothetical protein
VWRRVEANLGLNGGGHSVPPIHLDAVCALIATSVNGTDSRVPQLARDVAREVQLAAARLGHRVTIAAWQEDHDGVHRRVPSIVRTTITTTMMAISKSTPLVTVMEHCNLCRASRVHASSNLQRHVQSVEETAGGFVSRFSPQCRRARPRLLAKLTRLVRPWPPRPPGTHS